VSESRDMKSILRATAILSSTSMIGVLSGLRMTTLEVLRIWFSRCHLNAERVICIVP
jgi:hypothetical protein